MPPRTSRIILPGTGPIIRPGGAPGHPGTGTSITGNNIIITTIIRIIITRPGYTEIPQYMDITVRDAPMHPPFTRTG